MQAFFLPIRDQFPIVKPLLEVKKMSLLNPKHIVLYWNETKCVCKHMPWNIVHKIVLCTTFYYPQCIFGDSKFSNVTFSVLGQQMKSIDLITQQPMATLCNYCLRVMSSDCQIAWSQWTFWCTTHLLGNFNMSFGVSTVWSFLHVRTIGLAISQQVNQQKQVNKQRPDL